MSKFQLVLVGDGNMPEKGAVFAVADTTTLVNDKGPTGGVAGLELMTAEGPHGYMRIHPLFVEALNAVNEINDRGIERIGASLVHLVMSCGDVGICHNGDHLWWSGEDERECVACNGSMEIYDEDDEPIGECPGCDGEGFGKGPMVPILDYVMRVMKDRAEEVITVAKTQPPAE